MNRLRKITVLSGRLIRYRNYGECAACGNSPKNYLLMIQEQAEERFDLLAEQVAEREGVTEQLKAQEQIPWVRRMNNIRARAEEIVREETIYIL